MFTAAGVTIFTLLTYIMLLLRRAFALLYLRKDAADTSPPPILPRRCLLRYCQRHAAAADAMLR